MHVSDLYISNYRSIQNIHIPLAKGKNVIVGKNNSGKSNIILALDIILGEKSPTVNSFEEGDFRIYKEDDSTLVSEEMFIAVKISGSELNYEELRNVKYVREHRFGQENWINKNESGDFYLTDFFKRDIDSFESRDFDTFKESELIHWGKEISEIVLYVYAKRNQGGYIEVVNGLAVKKQKFEEYFRCYPVSRKLRDAFITSAVVPTFREPDKELRLNKWNWYGKLINKVWENRSNELNNEIKDINSQLSHFINFAFNSTSDELENRLHNLFNFENVIFRIVPKDNTELYQNIRLYIDDGVESLLSDKGTGIQSVIIIILFKYYCEHFHTEYSLLAVEEPELYLHPHSRRMLSNELDEFVTDNNQVIITSHSSDFLRNTEIENIVVVRKSPIDNSTKVYQLKNDENRVQEMQKIKQFLWGRNSEVFFAEKVILVEGGEEYILPVIADYLFSQTGIFDMENISVISVGGKSQFKSYIKLFQDLSIDYRVIADFDYLETGIEQLSDFAPNFDLSQLNDIRKRLRAYGGGFEKSKKIRKKLLHKDQKDAKSLCYLLDEICEKGEFLDELKDLWGYLRPKVSKRIRYQDLTDKDQEKVKDFLKKLRKDNIVILKGGELEDFYKEQAFKIFTETRIRGKELRVLKLAELIRAEVYELTNVLNISEYVEAIYDFTKECPSCKLDTYCDLRKNNVK